MHELIVNLHMHTIYSDGSGTHKEIANAALETGVDVVIITDHNVFVQGMEGYYQQGENRLLMLIGEEVHDVTRSPQKNHLLVLGAGREMSTIASKPQQLIDQVLRAKGLAFIAHPYDPELKAFGEDDISWVDWNVRGFTGIELWNGFSEFKSVVHSYLEGIFYALFPQYLAHGPHPEALKKWDELTTTGQRIVAVAGSDAHALKKGLGPIHRTIYPYTYHFQAINNHLLVDHPLTGDLASDRDMILDSLRKGHNYLGYDLPAPTRGFRFTAQGKDGSAIMGDEIRVGNGVTLQIRIPEKTECRLICDGDVIRTWRDREICAHIVSKPGVYRVECSIEYLGRSRGWIYSNPIYIRP
ncbi:MAG: CehA/McbA family metallohydrolase [Chloroflexi bacterium]|nr:CehA/McbA family metallohydrolase [Chloroflexota bacterium]